MKNRHIASALLAGAGLLAVAPDALAREYPIGGPVQAHDMEIAASYLVGIDLAPMPADMPMGPDVIHLETDVHATADNVWGYPDGAWIPYLTIEYTLSKVGTDWKVSGTMRAMTAKDGPHYANNVKMDGPGNYTVELRYNSPEKNGFLHHVDTETGTPGFWDTITEKFTFAYPQK
ncbi:iron transporter [Gluconacetobacter azotocaptans]|uniref:Iron transporter n=1 Tax=Gluconacetobacter azotocaptans TaxID=142834 RepID=A0A7W4JT26_9PROT|nr:iron transporter [Gluconacetobacter azotocaptans]MBB2190375.1 iron transporter [Gluconacetobacter azotocaptans]MBM9400588.1 iron transporter [Gluconacetobacter azotocaptans]GBQ30082.1 Fe2+ high-affinity transporter [Gluconacetobacter azotocaptans DSM 13594]